MMGTMATDLEHRLEPLGASVNRYYDPATGQFVSVDPLVGETGSAYGYVGDSPENEIDPTGLRPWWQSVTSVLNAGATVLATGAAVADFVGAGEVGAVLGETSAGLSVGSAALTCVEAGIRSTVCAQSAATAALPVVTVGLSKAAEVAAEESATASRLTRLRKTGARLVQTASDLAGLSAGLSAYPGIPGVNFDPNLTAAAYPCATP